jgi:hypothetical protein
MGRVFALVPLLAARPKPPQSQLARPLVELAPRKGRPRRRGRLDLAPRPLTDDWRLENPIAEDWCYWIESNAWRPRLTAAIILSGSAVQTKGFGFRFASAR